MARDLSTRFIGYAPDARDRDNPPEVVYWTETRRARPWRTALKYAVGFIATVGIVGFFDPSLGVPQSVAIAAGLLGGLGVVSFAR